MALYGFGVVAGIIIWCGVAMGTGGRAGIFVRGGETQNALHMYKKAPRMYKNATHMYKKIPHK